jgi:hypothetical protein
MSWGIQAVDGQSLKGGVKVALSLKAVLIISDL